MFLVTLKMQCNLSMHVEYFIHKYAGGAGGGWVGGGGGGGGG